MIFNHRQNDPSTWKADESVEFDARLFGDKSVMISHDPCQYDTNKDLEFQLDDIITNNYAMPKECIVNIKESGTEERVVELFKKIGYDDYYFLDSQIPDITRLSKKYNMAFRFIVRVSDIESLNFDFLRELKPKYIWLDWSKFNNFNMNEYKSFIRRTFSTLKQLPGKAPEIILVSPELYGPEYKKLAENMINDSELRHYKFKVCTKNEDWKYNRC
jgi:hypothetical protein